MDEEEAESCEDKEENGNDILLLRRGCLFGSPHMSQVRRLGLLRNVHVWHDQLSDTAGAEEGKGKGAGCCCWALIVAVGA